MRNTKISSFLFVPRIFLHFFMHVISKITHVRYCRRRGAARIRARMRPSRARSRRRLLKFVKSPVFFVHCHAPARVSGWSLVQNWEHLPYNLNEQEAFQAHFATVINQMSGSRFSSENDLTFSNIPVPCSGLLDGPSAANSNHMSIEKSILSNGFAHSQKGQEDGKRHTEPARQRGDRQTDRQTEGKSRVWESVVTHCQNAVRLIAKTYRII